MVNHKILLSKSHHYGIHDIALNWFQNYLETSEQYVTCNGETSNMQNIKYGVPQSILWLILENVCTHTMVIFFADDSNLVLNGTDPQTLKPNWITDWYK